MEKGNWSGQLAELETEARHRGPCRIPLFEAALAIFPYSHQYYTGIGLISLLFSL